MGSVSAVLACACMLVCVTFNVGLRDAWMLWSAGQEGGVVCCVRGREVCWVERAKRKREKNRFCFLGGFVSVFIR